MQNMLSVKSQSLTQYKFISCSYKSLVQVFGGRLSLSKIPPSSGFAFLYDFHILSVLSVDENKEICSYIC